MERSRLQHVGSACHVRPGTPYRRARLDVTFSRRFTPIEEGARTHAEHHRHYTHGKVRTRSTEIDIATENGQRRNHEPKFLPSFLSSVLLLSDSDSVTFSTS
ncbi:hypothetical protein NL676_004663 [Syzygium grande]|nr:hypothetical protein NL676_004663 [Syzygium grande]